MRKSEQVEPGSGTESSTDSDGNERKRELIFLLSTIQQKMTSLNVDNTKLELLFDKVEAFAAGETLPPVDVNCSGKGWGRCYEPIGSAHYWWCKETGFLSNYCDKPFDYM